ncbi:MAG: molecular chaperone TorD family protein [Bryobacteraceae bacterium]|nr:molecular chaperone TorD family protein [Bryobacteraceae bacterium]
MKPQPPALYALAGLALLETSESQLRQLIAELAEEAESEGHAAELYPSLLASLPEQPGALEREYVRLFLDPTGTLCPLWQSAYDEPRQLMGDSHFAALDWYRRHGLQTRHSNEPADHAAYLLMFYGRLLEEGADGETLRRFRQEHLRWIGLLAAKIQTETRLEFYRVLAGLLETLVNAEGGSAESPHRASEEGRHPAGDEHKH